MKNRHFFFLEYFQKFEIFSIMVKFSSTEILCKFFIIFDTIQLYPLIFLNVTLQYFELLKLIKFSVMNKSNVWQNISASSFKMNTKLHLVKMISNKGIVYRLVIACFRY